MNDDRYLGYSAALQEQATFTRLFNDPAEIRGLFNDLIDSGHSSRGVESMAATVGMLRHRLPVLTPIFWSKDFPIPDLGDEPFEFTVTPDRFPTKNGFLFFEQPLRPMPEQSDYVIGSICWFPVESDTIRRPNMYGFAMFEPTSSLETFTGILMYGIGELAPGRLFQKEDTHIVDEEISGPGRALTRNQYVVRLMNYCLTFMNQRVEAETTSAPANRDARKAAKRAGYEPNDVLIVQYRRAVKPTEPAEPTGRHISVQYEVGGHWRLQPCGPGRKTIRRVWVSEHKRGPEGAPPSPAKKKLLVMVR